MRTCENTTPVLSPSGGHAGITTVTYNFTGQRLGAKGQATRTKIIEAMLRLLADPQGPPVILSSVASEAGVRLTNLYRYFPNLTELLIAALTRVIETAERTYLDLIREPWPGERLRECCLRFLRSHLDFWMQHARLLHMRNAMADAGDPRVLAFRYTDTQPLIGLLVSQMGLSADNGMTDECQDIATVLLTCLERLATVVTTPHFGDVSGLQEEAGRTAFVAKLVEAEAGIIALVIADQRRRAFEERGAGLSALRCRA